MNTDMKFYPDDPDPEALFVGQRVAAVHACRMVQMATAILCDHHTGTAGDLKLDEYRRVARFQRDHMEQYMRIPPDKRISAVQRQLGSAIDRTLLSSAILLEKAIDLAETPARVKKIHMMRKRAEQARKARISERREHDRRAAAVPLAPPPVPTPKREKIEKPPLCSKCNKRPRVSGTLCEKCAKWVARHG